MTIKPGRTDARLVAASHRPQYLLARLIERNQIAGAGVRSPFATGICRRCVPIRSNSELRRAEARGAGQAEQRRESAGASGASALEGVKKVLTGDRDRPCVQ
jgi:hypothetical protein